MRLILLSLLFATLTAQAEQRVVYVTNSLFTQPDLTEVNRLLLKSWRVVNLSSSCDASDSVVTTVFVLESPTPEPPRAAPQSLDLKTVWQSAYTQSAGRGASDNTAREFADRCVAAVVAANPGTNP